MTRAGATRIRLIEALSLAIKPGKDRIAAIWMIVLMTFSVACLAEGTESKNWVEVTDPYIEFHTGPGVGFPIVYVVEKGESVEVLKEKTGWFKVVSNNGKSGWVNRSQMEQTLHLGTEKFIVTDIGENEFGKRTFEGGVAIGNFEGAKLLSAFLDYRFSNTLSVELDFNQINGSFSNSQMISIGVLNQPFNEWKISPYLYLGTGIIQTTPQTTLVQSEQRTDQIVSVGIGLKAHLSKRFVVRTEYKEHVVLTNRSKNEVIGEWKTGFSVFF